MHRESRSAVGLTPSPLRQNWALVEAAVPPLMAAWNALTTEEAQHLVGTMDSQYHRDDDSSIAAAVLFYTGNFALMYEVRAAFRLPTIFS